MGLASQGHRLRFRDTVLAIYQLNGHSVQENIDEGADSLKDAVDDGARAAQNFADDFERRAAQAADRMEAGSQQARGEVLLCAPMRSLRTLHTSALSWQISLEYADQLQEGIDEGSRRLENAIDQAPEGVANAVQRVSTPYL